MASVRGSDIPNGLAYFDTPTNCQLSLSGNYELIPDERLKANACRECNGGCSLAAVSQDTFRIKQVTGK